MLPLADREHCIPYARSLLAGCELGARRVANLATSFIDASVLYGTTHDETRRLRSHTGGRLRSSKSRNANGGGSGGDGDDDGELAPPLDEVAAIAAADARSVCSALAPSVAVDCFQFASPFASLLPTSAALQTTLLREHNRVAAALAALNAHWSDDRLFDEARRIVVAQLQRISESEWLPLVVGRELAARYALRADDDVNVYNMVSK